MKNLITILFSMLGIPYSQSKPKKYTEYDIIDLLVRTTPLIQPCLVLVFSVEECNYIRDKREKRLNEYAKYAKEIKGKGNALRYFTIALKDIKSDVNLDSDRAFNKTLENSIHSSKQIIL